MSASSSSMDPIGGLVVDTAGSVVKVKEAVTAAVGLSPGQVEQTARDGFTLHFGHQNTMSSRVRFHFKSNAFKTSASMPSGGTRSWQIPLRRSRLIAHELGDRYRKCRETQASGL